MIKPIFIFVIASIFGLLIIFFGVRMYNIITQKKLQKKFLQEHIRVKDIRISRPELSNIELLDIISKKQ